MITAFGISGVLPPFIGADPSNRASTSPYAATATEVVSRFATSAERVALLDGLLRYRAALASIGISNGFQWVDGSFVENCETIRQRPPGDVDVVTFAQRPPAAVQDHDWRQFISANSNLFVPQRTKADFSCDAYYIDLNKPASIIVLDTAYFNGLFSHQRDTAMWKGMILVALNSDDAAARQAISGAAHA
jgi:hypothetical protein